MKINIDNCPLMNYYDVVLYLSLKDGYRLPTLIELSSVELLEHAAFEFFWISDGKEYTDSILVGNIYGNTVRVQKDIKCKVLMIKKVDRQLNLNYTYQKLRKFKNNLKQVLTMTEHSL